VKINVIDPQTVLADFRANFRKLPEGDERRKGFIFAALGYIRRLEDCCHPDELWHTPGIRESELTPKTRIGEHIAVTRQAFGLIP